MRNQLIILILFVTFFAVNGFGQFRDDFITEKTSVSDEKIDRLLDEVLLKTSLIESTEDKSFILIHVIDILWERDKTKAEKISNEIAEKIRLALNRKNNDKSPNINLPYQYKDFRQELITTVVKHDYKFAGKLKNYTRPAALDFSPKNSNQAVTIYNLKTDERDLEQRMAFHTAAKDLQKGFEIATGSLQKGFSNEALNTLKRFHRRDAKLANAFADRLIDKLIKTNYSKDKTAFDTAGMFISQMDENKGAFNRKLDCECPQPLNLDRQKYHRFVSN